MTDIKLKYGNQKFDFSISGDTSFLKTEAPVDSVNRDEFEKNLTSRIKKEISSVGIILSDKTRLCGYEEYLPWLTDLLEKKYVSSAQITFYIAYGTHPAQSDEESYKVYGETFTKYRFVHHDCDAEDDMINMGTTSRGVSVNIRKDILDHDLLILFGAVSHHYFAGYGGGRKLIFPGLAARESIYENHKLFIEFDKNRLNPACQSGALHSNPVAEDLKEIDDMLPEKIIISGILNPSGNIYSLLFADSYDDFELTCKIYDKQYRKQDEPEYDTVIASSGGYPKDINFIQTHKSLHNAASFVKDGGNLIILGECIDGIGNEAFIKIFEGSKEAIFTNLKNKYSGNGGTALSMMAKTDRINIFMMTSLDQKTCDTINITKLNYSQAKNKMDKLEGSIAIIANASIIYC